MQVNPLTASQLEVTWEPPPPESQNGNIQGYKASPPRGAVFPPGHLWTRAGGLDAPPAHGRPQLSPPSASCASTRQPSPTEQWAPPRGWTRLGPPPPGPGGGGRLTVGPAGPPSQAGPLLALHPFGEPPPPLLTVQRGPWGDQALPPAPPSFTTGRFPSLDSVGPGWGPKMCICNKLPSRPGSWGPQFENPDTDLF